MATKTNAIGLYIGTDIPLSANKGGSGVSNSFNATWAGTVSIGGTFTTLGTFIQSGAFNFLYTLTGNTNVTFPQSGTLAVIGQGLPTVSVTSSTQTLAANTRYIANFGSIITYNLPATSAVGDVIIINNTLGLGGFTILQGTGQSIVNQGTTTTVTTGSVSSDSTTPWCNLSLTCVVANTKFTVDYFTGTLDLI